MEQTITLNKPYLLSRHAYLCIDADEAIFLDLRADKYLALPGVQARRLAGLIAGWPIPFDDQSGDRLVVPHRLIDSLMERRLITSNQEVGKDATPVTLGTPTEAIDADVWGGSASIGVVDLMNFSTSVLTASLWLRLRSIESTVQHVQQRRRSIEGLTTPSTESLARLIAVFVRLRPYVFTSRDKCLLETLSLMEFLSHSRIFPAWVFAVHAHPFAAHCWLQLGSTVLNDTLENVQSFTPILVA